MRPKTQCCVAIRFVGDANRIDEVFEGTFVDCWTAVSKLLIDTMLLTRFDISVARTREIALTGLNKGTPAQKAKERSESLTSLLENIFAANGEDDVDS